MIKKLCVYLFLLLLLGCSSASISPSAHSTPSPKKKPKLGEVKISLTVTPTPSDARIRILNIVPKYKNEIILKKGKYHIEVSKPGYQTIKKWIELDSSKNVEVSLKKKITHTYNGSFVWQGAPINSDYKKLYFTNGLVWALETKKNLIYSDAKRYCKSLRVSDGGVTLSNFRLATTDEILLTFSKGSLFGHKRLSVWTSSVSELSLKNVPKNYYYYSMYINNSGSDLGNSYPEKGRDRTHSALCVSDGLNLKINETANKIYKYSENNTGKMKLPKKPAKPKGKALVKGEFETTNEFNDRVKSEQLKDTIKHKKAVELWEYEIVKIKNSNKNKKEAFKKNKSYNMENAFQKAMSLIYGSPKIKSAHYDADQEAFNINITSSNGTYSNRVQIPVESRYARQFKEILTAKNFEPTIEFKIKNSNVLFLNIREIISPNQLVIETAYKNTKNTTVSLNEFISKYPDSPYAEEAKIKVDKLLKEATKARERQEEIKLARKKKYDKEKREKEIARKKAEHDFLTLGTCSIGETVYHRERWNTKTSSGNIIADNLFGAATKEQFVVVYEGIVKGFLGEKVEVIINDYSIKQTIGGGFLKPYTLRKFEIEKHADKYLGKTQFYNKKRCT